MMTRLKPKAEINELFVSLQGEGVYIGARQAFIRFAGCNMACGYCDTDFSPKLSLTTHELVAFVKEAGPIHSAALTGGEPLRQQAFLQDFLPALKKTGVRTYLETNGTLARELETVKDQLDFIAMDIKIPSVTGDRACWPEHAAFIDVIAKNSLPAFYKIVLSMAFDPREIPSVIKLLSRSTGLPTVVLQPVHEQVHDPRLMKKLLEWQKLLAEAGDIMIIPQMHKLLGIK